MAYGKYRYWYRVWTMNSEHPIQVLCSVNALTADSAKQTVKKETGINKYHLACVDIFYGDYDYIKESFDERRGTTN